MPKTTAPTNSHRFTYASIASGQHKTTQPSEEKPATSALPSDPKAATGLRKSNEQRGRNLATPKQPASEKVKVEAETPSSSMVDAHTQTTLLDVQQLEADVASLQTKLNQATSERDVARVELEELKNNAKPLEEELEFAKQQLGEAIGPKNVPILFDMRVRLQKTRDANNEEVSKLEKRISDLKSGLDKNKEEIKERTIRIEEQTTEISSLEKKLETTSSALKWARDELNKTNKELKQTKLDLEETKKDLEFEQEKINAINNFWLPEVQRDVDHDKALFEKAEKELKGKLKQSEEEVAQLKGFCGRLMKKIKKIDPSGNSKDLLGEVSQWLKEHEA